MIVSWTFVLTTAITFVLYWWICPVKHRGYLLTIVSFLYFAQFVFKDMVFLLILALSVFAVNRRAIEKRSNVWAGTAWAVIGLVAVLGYFKYAGFLVDTLEAMLGWQLPQVQARLASWAAPLGISYFTFKMIHYVVDSYKGEIPRHRLIDFLNYIFFFPILVSGPIQRFQPFLQDSRQISDLKQEDVFWGLSRVVWGFFKKVVLAEMFASLAAGLYQPGLPASEYWVASLAYTMQIYLDFSGYSDIAIGVGRLFGYHIMENFASPYLARDLSSFWKKWHMSLTGWFRDYLFIPLGGSRGSLAMIIRNTFIVMAVTGLWHGAAWHFVWWGIYHAVGLTVLRLYRKFALPTLESRYHLKGRRSIKWASMALTFFYVNVGWVLFACNGQQGLYVLARMFGLK